MALPHKTWEKRQGENNFVGSLQSDRLQMLEVARVSDQLHAFNSSFPSFFKSIPIIGPYISIAFVMLAILGYGWRWLRNWYSASDNVIENAKIRGQKRNDPLWLILNLICLTPTILFTFIFPPLGLLLAASVSGVEGGITAGGYFDDLYRSMVFRDVVAAEARRLLELDADTSVDKILVAMATKREQLLSNSLSESEYYQNAMKIIKLEHQLEKAQAGVKRDAGLAVSKVCIAVGLCLGALSILILPLAPISITLILIGALLTFNFRKIGIENNKAIDRKYEKEQQKLHGNYSKHKVKLAIQNSSKLIQQLNSNRNSLLTAGSSSSLSPESHEITPSSLLSTSPTLSPQFPTIPSTEKAPEEQTPPLQNKVVNEKKPSRKRKESDEAEKCRSSSVGLPDKRERPPRLTVKRSKSLDMPVTQSSMSSLPPSISDSTSQAIASTSTSAPASSVSSSESDVNSVESAEIKQKSFPLMRRQTLPNLSLIGSSSQLMSYLKPLSNPMVRSRTAPDPSPIPQSAAAICLSPAYAAHQGLFSSSIASLKSSSIRSDGLSSSVSSSPPPLLSPLPQSAQEAFGLS